ncbi:MAG TPA: hypothetical protein VFV75_09840 [Candidatus Polarisedimenticolaceae bacterium]|nr:hypothetical protein [Candidatus Polarisedimenticolaceae bacterium]
MRERSMFSRRLVLGVILGAVAAAAHARTTDPAATPSRYLGRGVDTGLVTATNPLDGRLYSAWTYRAGSETDIAVSVRNAEGVWSEPVFVGYSDGRNQVDPALSFDAAGNLYLAHTLQESGQVVVSRLAAGATRLSSQMLVSLPGERAFAPTLMPIETALLVGYRVGDRVVLRMVSLTAASSPLGIQDGPDGFPPSRNETEGDAEDSANGIGI